MPLSFRVRPIPLLAAILVTGAGLALGQWQLSRAAEKIALQDRMSERVAAPPVALTAADTANADALEFRRVTLRGQFLPDWPLYLENRPYHGVAGVFVVMPFRLAGSDRHVLVLRGWVARDGADRTRLPAISTPAGEIELAGMARRNAGRVLQLGQAPVPKPGVFLQNLEPAQFASASGLSTSDFVVEQSTMIVDGLVRDWPLPASGVERHYGYAFQWFALAATAFIFFVVTGIRRGPKQPQHGKAEQPERGKYRQ